MFVSQKKLPTNAKGAVSFVRGSGRTAVWVVMVLLGLGLVAVTLPFLKRIPILGGILQGGREMLPGADTEMTVDQWGRVR